MSLTLTTSEVTLILSSFVAERDNIASAIRLLDRVKTAESKSAVQTLEARSEKINKLFLAFQFATTVTLTREESNGKN